MTTPKQFVGIRNRASVSVTLGNRDPRTRRNLQAQVPGEDYAEPLFIDEFGRLAVDEDLLVAMIGAATRFEMDVGDGSATSIAVPHRLGTRAVHVTLYSNSGTYAEFVPTVEHTDPNTVTLVFGVAPTLNQYHVLVSL